MTASTLEQRSQASAAAARVARELCNVAELAGWRGPDSYDGLWRRWPRPLRGGRRRRQAIIQLHARSPVDVRRLYRRDHPRLAKSLAAFASAGVRLQALGDGREHIERPLEVLLEDHSSGTPGWGYPFDTQTRWSFYPADSPNVVVTSFAVCALDEAARALTVERYAERARAAGEWLQEELFLASDGIYAYHAGSRSLIHNANLLGARAVHRALGDDAGALDAIRRAVERTLAAQRPDGAWPYGEGPGLDFVDSFHTGYVLGCLAELETLDPRIAEAIERGGEYYVRRFFGEGGEARLWPDRPFPEDGHSAGTGMTSLAMLTRRDRAHEQLLERVTQRSLSHMVAGGRGVHRRYRWGTTRVAYLRWVDAHMAIGLADAALALRAR